MKKLLTILVGGLLLASALLMSACDDTNADTDTAAATEAATEKATEAQTDATTEVATEVVTEKATEAATEAPAEVQTQAQTEALTEAQTEAGTEGPETVATLNGKTPAQVVAEILATYTDNYTAVNEMTMDMSMNQDGVSMDMSISETIFAKRQGYNLYNKEVMDGEVVTELWYVDGMLYTEDVDEEGNPVKVKMAMTPNELVGMGVAEFDDINMMPIPAAWLENGVFVKNGDKYLITVTADADMILASAEELNLSELGEEGTVRAMTINWSINADGTLDFAEYDIDMTMMGMDCRVYNKAKLSDADTTVVTLPEGADEYIEVAYPPVAEDETDVGGAVTEASTEATTDATEATTDATEAEVV